MDFLTKFPVMDRKSLMELRKGIDQTFREFSRAYGDGIEAFFDPLLFFLIVVRKIIISYTLANNIINTWWFGLVRFKKLETCSWKCNSFCLIGYFGMWKDCMATVAIITVCTIMCIAVGIPIGVLMARSNRVERSMLTCFRYDANYS